MGSIRLFLALAVLVSHATPFDIDMVPGPVAVQAFFIISGFYMSLILKEKYGPQGISVFYTNRLLRLLPTYFFVLLISLGVLFILDIGIFTHLDKFERVFAQSLFMALSYLWTNIAVLGQEILFLVGVDTENGTFYWAPQGLAPEKAWSQVLVPQAWSLSFELYFYLLAPYIFRRNAYLVATLFLLSLFLRVLILSMGAEYDLLVRRFFPAELCFFLAGYFSHLLFTKVEVYEKRWLAGSLCWIIVVLVLIFYNRINDTYSLALLACIMFVSIPFIFGFLRANKIDRFLGNLSYPIYIVHFLIIAIFDEYVEEYSLFSLLLVVFSASAVLYYFIEAPIDRWRQRRVASLCTVQ